jgi:hypothetical protein
MPAPQEQAFLFGRGSCKAQNDFVVFFIHILSNAVSCPAFRQLPKQIQ